ncbi:DnaJ domain containing protein [Ascosphaera apis ARSEF 7405]|uniref:DnaJ domain containing protein n=1 Tax=Ascosphaera apis ARSEF 7405 TaxID=392613 RepID=A0A168DU18_9EURO|nr:DnaJ domain containing protein [Ascosphaera apis ARSEF 7405]
MSSLLSYAMSYASWAFVPKFITNYVQLAYYKYRPSRSPPPAEGSPEYQRDKRRIYILISTCYLLYTIWSTYMGILSRGDFYRLLGVTPLSTEREIRSRYRRLATMLHPDKMRLQGSSLGTLPGQEEMYMALKTAYETITNPTLRFAYDRFGQVIAPTEKLSASTRLQEVMIAVLKIIAPQRCMEFGALVLWSFVWFSTWGRYWRFYFFFATLVCEMIMLTRVNITIALPAYLPTRIVTLLGLQNTFLLPFQLMTLLRSTCTAISIFICQIAPPQQPTKTKQDKLLPEALDAHMLRVLAMVNDTDREATRINQALEAPYYHLGEDEPYTVGEFRKGMKRALIDREIKSEPRVMDVVRRAVNRRVEGMRMQKKSAMLERKRGQEESMGGDIARLFGVRFFDRLMKEAQYIPKKGEVENDNVTARSMEGGKGKEKEDVKTVDGSEQEIWDESEEEYFTSDEEDEEDENDSAGLGEE